MFYPEKTLFIVNIIIAITLEIILAVEKKHFYKSGYNWVSLRGWQSRNYIMPANTLPLDEEGTKNGFKRSNFKKHFFKFWEANVSFVNGFSLNFIGTWFLKL